MIAYKTGDITIEDAEALVNTVNCVGVMGKGIALAFKQAFPGNFKAYAEACKLGAVQPGRMFVFETGRPTNPHYIINFPTKRHWRAKSRMEDIDSGLRALVDEIRTREILSVALPPLGSGSGGLDWNEVRSRIDGALGGLSGVHIIVYEPGGQAVEQSSAGRAAPKMTPGRAALVSLMGRYLAGYVDPFVTLLEVHKLMYFLQGAGEPLRLRFAKGVYGPYAENLRFALRDVEGHLINGYRGDESPTTELDILPGALDEANAFLSQHSETSYRMGRVGRLVEGFESPFGLELLATVHWVAAGSASPLALDEIVSRVWAWNERKRQFTERQIRIALGRLRDEGWLPVAS